MRQEQCVHGPEATTLLLVLAHRPWTFTDEAMSTSSRMAQEVDEAMSETSWTALAKEKERDCWSIDLEGEVEKLEVRGPWSVTEGDSVEPKGEVGHNPDRTRGSKKRKRKVEGR